MLMDTLLVMLPAQGSACCWHRPRLAIDMYRASLAVSDFGLKNEQG